MTTIRPPRVLSYFEALETKYGVHFTFDALTEEELQTLEAYTREAIDSSHGLGADDQRNLGVLLKLIREQLTYRYRSQWMKQRTGTGR